MTSKLTEKLQKQEKLFRGIRGQFLLSHEKFDNFAKALKNSRFFAGKDNLRKEGQPKREGKGLHYTLPQNQSTE